MIRPLDDREKEIAEKQIRRMNEELNHYDFLLRYNQLMVEEGCYWTYQDKLNIHKEAEKDMISEIGINKEKIKILEDQIKNGVEIKEERIELPSGVG